MTCMDFLRLEKIGYGGIKGHMLTELTDALYREFQDQYHVFAESSYNCLNIADKVC